MKILVVHAIQRNTLNLIIESGEKKGHKIQTCNLGELNIYDGKIMCNNEDIANYDIILFREIRNFNEEAKMVTSYLNERDKIIIDERIRDGRGGSKINTYLTLSKEGIPFPKTMFFSSIEKKSFGEIAFNLGVPFIMKIINGQQGKGVYLINNEKEFEQNKISGIDEKFLFQEFIPNNGDIRVLVIGGTIIGSIKRTAQQGEFRNNVALGGSTEKTEISEKIKEMAINASKRLGLSIAGVDVIIDKRTGNPYILEVNRSPEFEGFIKTTGINVADEIISFLEKTGN